MVFISQFFPSLSLLLSSLFLSFFFSTFNFFVSPVNSVSLLMTTPDILTTNKLSSADLCWCDLIKHKICYPS